MLQHRQHWSHKSPSTSKDTQKAPLSSQHQQRVTDPRSYACVESHSILTSAFAKPLLRRHRNRNRAPPPLQRIIATNRIDEHTMGDCKDCGCPLDRPCILFVWEECSEQCNGNPVECDDCAGRGWVQRSNWSPPVPCAKCKGTRWISCEKCHEGSGWEREEQDYCKGLGGSHPMHFRFKSEECYWKCEDECNKKGAQN